MGNIRRYVRGRFQKAAPGFTVVEIIIIIVVIGILASIGVTTYHGIQNRAKLFRQQDHLKQVQELLEVYHAQHEAFPATTNKEKINWQAVDVLTDANCFNGSSQPDWIPGLTEQLPQSDPDAAPGVDGKVGCYLYASNGEEYVLSAWNMLSIPQTSTMYRRLGFREFQTSTSTQFYTCNSKPIGGASGGYDITQDYYKHSYTLSNITTCDETPPPGA